VEVEMVGLWSKGAALGWCAVVALAAGLLVGVTPARAQDSYNRGGATAPEGVWLGGGLYTASGSGTGVRMEVGLPLKVVGPGLLSVTLPVSTWHNGARFCPPFDPCMRWRANALYVVPEVQYEYVLPIRMKHRFSIVPFAGAGFALYWSYFDDYPGVGTAREMSPGVAVRTGGAARFGFLNGVFVQIQPVGLLFNIPFDGQPRGGMGEVVYGRSFWFSYDFYLMAGYRFN
jgi:hypothetical protein